MERWKRIPGYEGRYEVSDLGRVRSLNFKQTGKTHLLRQIVMNGYKQVTLCNGIGNGLPHRVHRVVLVSFDGLPAKGRECRHLNGISTDNRLCNLAWGTSAENSADVDKHGHQSRGQKHHSAKLTDGQVLEIRSKRHVLATQLAKEYGVSKSAIWHIRYGTTWGHLK